VKKIQANFCSSKKILWAQRDALIRMDRALQSITAESDWDAYNIPILIFLFISIVINME